MEDLVGKKYLELSMMFDTFKYIPRLATKRIPLIEKESVASHIYEMIWLAYLSYYSMDTKDQENLDLLKVLKLILWHEADESLTNDIPYPAKKLVKNKGHEHILKKLKEISSEYIVNKVPNQILLQDTDVINETLTDQTSSEKKFVKFLDYVNLYLNLKKLERKGYPVGESIVECSRLTRFNNDFYSKVPAVRYLMDNYNEFLNLEDN